MPDHKRNNMMSFAFHNLPGKRLTFLLLLLLMAVMAVPFQGLAAGSASPDISISSYGENAAAGEATFYFASGLTMSELPVTGKAFSLPYIMTFTVENMDLYPNGLDWQMTRKSGSADAVLNSRNDGMNGDLDMRTMPSSAGDSVFEIRCLDNGKVIWRKNCTVHVKKLDQSLPAGNLRNGGRTVNGGWYANVEEAIPMSDIFDFRNGWRIQGESHLLVSMDSDDDLFWENVGCGEGLKWDMSLRKKGIYPVSVITSCRNISRAAEYTLYVGKTPRITGDTIRIPGGVKTIAAESFMNTNAQVVIIPYGCTSIGANAFAGSSRLREVEIPKSVTSLDSTAFDSCPNLEVFITTSTAAVKYAEAHGILAAAE